MITTPAMYRRAAALAQRMRRLGVVVSVADLLAAAAEIARREQRN